MAELATGCGSAGLLEDADVDMGATAVTGWADFGGVGGCTGFKRRPGAARWEEIFGCAGVVSRL